MGTFPEHTTVTNQSQFVLRARTVVPVSRAPIANGAVLIRGKRIIQVGRWTEFEPDISKGTILDLGDVVLLPGLINAHCHLDYTDMAGLFPPQKSFTDWIKLITTAKADWSYSEYAESWLNGAKMLLRTGTTTVADFEAVPELLPEVWCATPLRVISFLELTGVRSRRQPRAMTREALDRIESLSHERSRASLAPHAPYSTVPELVRLCAETAREHSLPLSVHVAESAQEYAMFTRRDGELFHWLRRNERDMSDCGKCSPIEHLERQHALGPNLLAVHVNHLGRRDAGLLKKRKVSVVHCPRSHAYFQHRKFPFEKLAGQSVNICLGTDSLATVIKTRRQSVALNLFEEMRAFAVANPRVPPKTILQMATMNGAKALGHKGQFGEIAPGAYADLIALPFRGKTLEVFDGIIAHRSDVSASLIDGRWAVAPQ